jgi:hypothetical protein
MQRFFSCVGDQLYRPGIRDIKSSLAGFGLLSTDHPNLSFARLVAQEKNSVELPF